MSTLQVSDLWKSFGAERAVLRGVELEVAAGTLSAVLGLSGCGKTTLLRLIAGLDRAERGSISLGSATLDDGLVFVSPEHRRIGYVPQEGALFPHMTVEGNVGFGLSRAERRGRAVGDLLEMVGLSALAKRLPHELSGGERQRVALARALARGPELLLLDEPFSSLDATLRGQVREEVSRLLREHGVTTVLVTHDQEEALSLADSVAVLRDGVIVQDGAPDELYNRPLDARLARFLGAANLLDADFRDGIAHTSLGALGVRVDNGRSLPAHGTVLLRPEQLLVSAQAFGEGDGEGGDGLAGRVQRCRYYGHDALMEVGVESSAGPRPRSLLARVPGERALPIGTAVRVRAQGSATLVEDRNGGDPPGRRSGPAELDRKEDDDR